MKGAYPSYGTAVPETGDVHLITLPGAINVPVSVGGMTVMPGDIVVGDHQDGLVAFSTKEAPTVIEKALKQRDAEEATMRAMALPGFRGGGGLGVMRCAEIG